MALDGIVLGSIVKELKDSLIGGRIDKIYQIEKEEILLSVRCPGSAYKVLLSANSSYPRIHLSTLSKNSEQTPPMFCMLLRKHLGGGKVVDITQPDNERIVNIQIEATNELGDKEVKTLIIEIMGRHSNIILTKEDGTIIDSIKHIANDKSSVREILPNRAYMPVPTAASKVNPLTTTKDEFESIIAHKEDMPIFKALYTSFNGFSPMLARSICLFLPDENISYHDLSEENKAALLTHFMSVITRVKEHSYNPCIFTNGDTYDFYCFPLEIYSGCESKSFDSVSKMLEEYYFKKNTHFNVQQKTHDIKKVISNYLDRAVRKKEIQEKALEETASKEKYKIYGELITAYNYQIEKGAESTEVSNYYEEDAPMITIKLDPQKTATENAQSYFNKYSKLKRTEVAANEQLEIINEDIKYLHSVLLSLDLLETREDIAQLRTELVEMGYLKKKKGAAKNKPNKKALPFLHFKSTKGHDIYVGKNNYQNDELTMKFAKNNDMWLHIKDGPGSHVIIKYLEGVPIDDEITLEGAKLAAYFSSGRMSSKVPIDYTIKKYVKKVPNAKPGMVIYTNFQTLFVTPSKDDVNKLSI